MKPIWKKYLICPLILYDTSSFLLITTKYIDESNVTTEEMNQKIYEQIINNIIQDFEVSNGEEIIVEGKDSFYFILTSLENQLNKAGNKNKTNQFSRIDLGECEDILREKYNLSKNISLIILKYEKMTNISSERNLQYEVYESLNKKKLDLSLCQNIAINIYVPAILSEKLTDLYNELQDLGYDLFDINNKFYQDICTPYKSQNGTDVLLSDRIDYYFNNDETQCQPNCQFSDYSIETEDLKCECNIVNSEINIEQNNKEIGSKSIYKSFYDVLKFSNYKVLNSYKLAFSSSIFYNNKGNIIILIFFCIFFIFIIIYFIKGKKELKNDLSKIIYNNKSIYNNNKPIILNQKIENLNKINIDNLSIFKNNKTISLKNNNIKQEKNNRKSNNEKITLRNDIKTKRRKPRIIFDFPPKKQLNNYNIIKIYDNIPKSRDKDSKMTLKKIKAESNREFNETPNNQKISQKILSSNKLETLDNYELNNLEYDMAIKLDKRKFFEIYWSLLRREHLIYSLFL